MDNLFSFAGGMMDGFMRPAKDGADGASHGSSNGSGAGGQGVNMYAPSPYADYGIRYSGPISQGLSARHTQASMLYPETGSLQGAGMQQGPLPTPVRLKLPNAVLTHNFQAQGLPPGKGAGEIWTHEEINTLQNAREKIFSNVSTEGLASFLSHYVEKTGQFEIKRNAELLKKTPDEIFSFTALMFSDMPQIFECFEITAGDTLPLLQNAPDMIGKKLKRNINAAQIFNVKVADVLFEVLVRGIITPTRVATAKNESVFISILNGYSSTVSTKQFGGPLDEEDTILKKGKYTNLDMLHLITKYKMHNYIFTFLFWDYMEHEHPDAEWVYPNSRRQVYV